MHRKVVVVGSLSRDLLVKAPRLPQRGETIRGTEFGMFCGGKGNNQALAAARAGANVAMVGRVGNDEFGSTIIESLKNTGVDSTYVLRDPDVGSGIAIIIVGGDGDNSIVIAQQANLKLCSQDVEKASELIRTASIVLLQMEVSIEPNVAAAKLARKAGVMVALNPAPAPEDGKLPDELLRSVDIIIPNQTEATLLTGIDSSSREGALKAARALKQMGPRHVILTLGQDGALLLEDDKEPQFISSFAVTAIDTTAAGDAFCGAFGASLSSGLGLGEAVRYGCAAGALACTTIGAEPSLPLKAQIDELFASSIASAR